MAVADAWGKKAEEDVVTTAEMLEKKGEERGLRVGRAQGLAEGQAAAVLRILANRGLPVSDDLCTRILACEDLAMLGLWLDRAMTAKSAAEVVGE